MAWDMRVGLLVYALDRPLTGIGRYTLELTRALRVLKKELEVVLLTAGNPGPLANEDFQRVSLTGCRLLPGLATLGNVFVPLLARRLNLDIIHDPTGITPFLFGAADARTVVTVHDVFPWSCPGTSTLLDTLIYRHWLPHLLPRVRAVITVSQHSLRDIQHYLGLLPQRLHVIPYGISARFHPLPPDVVEVHLRKRLGLSKPYILYVGALTIRKNVESALQAFALLENRFSHLCFVLAGPRTWKKTAVEDTIQRLGITDRVILPGPLTDTDLPALYSGADLFVFPSLYEGFGLPPLEAMACGIPVVCSNAASLPEVVGDAAVTVDPYDVEGLAEAMHRVLTDADLREELREKGLERAKQFTWERTARETVAVYREVAG
jgi:glycosyltransferase involved in cell wall biosynthesis